MLLEAFMLAYAHQISERIHTKKLTVGYLQQGKIGMGIVEHRDSCEIVTSFDPSSFYLFTSTTACYPFTHKKKKI